MPTMSDRMNASPKSTTDAAEAVSSAFPNVQSSDFIFPISKSFVESYPPANNTPTLMNVMAMAA